jgi:hypothetical protein
MKRPRRFIVRRAASPSTPDGLALTTTALGEIGNVVSDRYRLGTGRAAPPQGFGFEAAPHARETGV